MARRRPDCPEPFMRPSALRIVTALFFSAACTAPGAAQPAEQWTLAQLGNMLRAGVTWPDLQPALLQMYRANDPTGEGVSQKSFETARRIQVAQMRASLIQQRLVHDLDGDGN